MKVTVAPAAALAASFRFGNPSRFGCVPFKNAALFLADSARVGLISGDLLVYQENPDDENMFRRQRPAGFSKRLYRMDLPNQQDRGDEQ